MNTVCISTFGEVVCGADIVDLIFSNILFEYSGVRVLFIDLIFAIGAFSCVFKSNNGNKCDVDNFSWREIFQPGLKKLFLIGLASR